VVTSPDSVPKVPVCLRRIRREFNARQYRQRALRGEIRERVRRRSVPNPPPQGEPPGTESILVEYFKPAARSKRSPIINCDPTGDRRQRAARSEMAPGGLNRLISVAWRPRVLHRMQPAAYPRCRRVVMGPAPSPSGASRAPATSARRPYSSVLQDATERCFSPRREEQEKSSNLGFPGSGQRWIPRHPADQRASQAGRHSQVRLSLVTRWGAPPATATIQRSP
jgi:hypothetical protein